MNEEEFNKWMDRRHDRFWKPIRVIGYVILIYILSIPVINWLTGYGFGYY